MNGLSEDGVHPNNINFDEADTVELSAELLDVDEATRRAAPVYDLTARINQVRERMGRAGAIPEPRHAILKRVASGKAIGNPMLTGPPLGDILAGYIEKEGVNEGDEESEAPLKLDFEQIIKAFIAMRADVLGDASMGQKNGVKLKII